MVKPRCGRQNRKIAKKVHFRTEGFVPNPTKHPSEAFLSYAATKDFRLEILSKFEFEVIEPSGHFRSKKSPKGTWWGFGTKHQISTHSRPKLGFFAILTSAPQFTLN